MSVVDNEYFNKVYNKLTALLDVKIKQIVGLRHLGYRIDYNKVKLLNLYIRYLEDIKHSKYQYSNIASLNNISNFLNSI